MALCPTLTLLKPQMFHWVLALMTSAFGWSDRYFDRMSPLQKDALIRNVTRLVVETDFTGWSSFIQILLMTCTALNRRLSSPIPVPREEFASEFDPFRFDMLSSRGCPGVVPGLSRGARGCRGVVPGLTRGHCHTKLETTRE